MKLVCHTKHDFLTREKLTEIAEAAFRIYGIESGAELHVCVRENNTGDGNTLGEYWQEKVMEQNSPVPKHYINLYPAGLTETHMVFVFLHELKHLEQVVSGDMVRGFGCFRFRGRTYDLDVREQAKKMSVLQEIYLEWERDANLAAAEALTECVPGKEAKEFAARQKLMYENPRAFVAGCLETWKKHMVLWLNMPVMIAVTAFLGLMLGVNLLSSPFSWSGAAGAVSAVLAVAGLWTTYRDIHCKFFRLRDLSRPTVYGEGV